MGSGFERDIAMDMLTKETLTPGDVAAFREYIFETGLTSRAEAERLLELDHGSAALVPGWSAFFVEALKDFVVWQCRPTGRVTESDLDWLLGTLGDQPTPNGQALVFHILREAHEAPARLAEVAMRHEFSGSRGL
jgi:hypothetical protein